MPSYPPPQSHYVPTEGTRARRDSGRWLGGWLGGGVSNDSMSSTASKIGQQSGSWSTLTNSSSSTATELAPKDRLSGFDL